MIEQSKLARIFKALACEQRLRLFCMIFEKCQGDSSTSCADDSDCCGSYAKAFTEACGCMELSKSTISHHMKELESAGLIETQKDGQSTVCRVNTEAVEAIRGFLGEKFFALQK